MNEKALRTLEFDKIREMLVHHAGSDLGRKRCGELVPADTKEDAERLQTETADALNRLNLKGTLSFSGIPDIGESLLRLDRGGCLQIPELLRIGSLLSAVARAKSYGCPGTVATTFLRTRFRRNSNSLRSGRRRHLKSADASSRKRKLRMTQAPD